MLLANLDNFFVSNDTLCRHWLHHSAPVNSTLSSVSTMAGENARTARHPEPIHPRTLYLMRISRTMKDHAGRIEELRPDSFSNITSASAPLHQASALSPPVPRSTMQLTATKIRANVSVSEQLSEEQSRHSSAAVRSAGWGYLD